MLDARDAQARHPAAVDRPLPACEFLEAEPVALARLVYGEQAAVDRGDDLGLAAHDPARRVGRRQRVQRQRFAERTDDLGGADFLVLDHTHSIKSSTGGIGSTDSHLPIREGFKIGSASGRERECKYVEISVVAVSLTK